MSRSRYVRHKPVCDMQCETCTIPVNDCRGGTGRMQYKSPLPPGMRKQLNAESQGHGVGEHGTRGRRKSWPGRGGA